MSIKKTALTQVTVFVADASISIQVFQEKVYF